jgi:Zn-dependent oligopeptidase
MYDWNRENFCYDAATLKAISSHVDNKESVPEPLYKKLLAGNIERPKLIVKRACVCQLAIIVQPLAC